MMQQKLAELGKAIADAKNLKDSSKRQLRSYLQQVDTPPKTEQQINLPISQLEILKWYVAKEKALYHALNHFKQGQSVFIGFFWSPTYEKENIFGNLRAFSTTRCVEIHGHGIQPPTHF